MRIAIAAWAFLYLHGCAYLPPQSREVSIPLSIAEEVLVWRSLGGVGAPPPVVFLEPNCTMRAPGGELPGILSQSANGCVRGEAGGDGVIYLAAVATWRQTLRHEAWHRIADMSRDHAAPLWVQCGDFRCPNPAHAKPRAAFADIGTRHAYGNP